jgi:hypothetical protein
MNIEIRCTGFAIVGNIADLLPAPVLHGVATPRFPSELNSDATLGRDGDATFLGDLGIRQGVYAAIPSELNSDATLIRYNI